MTDSSQMGLSLGGDRKTSLYMKDLVKQTKMRFGENGRYKGMVFLFAYSLTLTTDAVTR